MPIVNRSNNRLLPANARASDVAEKAIREITPIQQRKYQDAFRVQGVEAILYSRLNQGQKCTCQSSRKALNSHLDLQGRASEAAITDMILGSGRGSGIASYGSEVFENETSPLAPVNKYQQGTFNNSYDIETTRIGEDDDPFGLNEVFMDDGPTQEQTLDDIVSGFDPSVLGFSDAACPVCFGSGFIGGYAPYHAFRLVLTPESKQVKLDEQSQINPADKPWTCVSESLSFSLVLPRAALGVDSFRLMNGQDQIGAEFRIGTTLVTNQVLLQSCTGMPVTITVEFSRPTKWTHLEIQLVTSRESARFELPRRSHSSDISMLETTEPFQIVMSPDVPTLRQEDVIAESLTGKILIVQSLNPWTTKDHNILGWECQVRPIQPMELYNLLPRRGRILSKPVTTLMTRDNVTGPRRT